MLCITRAGVGRVSKCECVKCETTGAFPRGRPAGGVWKVFGSFCRRSQHQELQVQSRAARECASDIGPPCLSRAANPAVAPCPLRSSCRADRALDATAELPAASARLPDTCEGASEYMCVSL
ncbi:hypothetical protein chiPu_0021973 [Chiloscyllium punctatum]|uniref:Uncharacterized protein n=1 Tax=Chiloscyllium punctatum TaxID=137246 RepID=A0A401RGE8_CHIPU|nr:hypothetical protein [Chiloscyllium punctatum]